MTTQEIAVAADFLEENGFESVAAMLRDISELRPDCRSCNGTGLEAEIKGRLYPCLNCAGSTKEPAYRWLDNNWVNF